MPPVDALSTAFAERLAYCGGNMTTGVGDDASRISLSPFLFHMVRRELGWQEPVRRLDTMTRKEVTDFTTLIDLLASQF